LELLAFIAARMAFMSSLSQMTGLRPHPVLVCKPQKPSRMYRAIFAGDINFKYSGKSGIFVVVI
jgi:hypothetical protein